MSYFTLQIDLDTSTVCPRTVWIECREANEDALLQRYGSAKATLGER
jgi:hypothetical protein